VWLLLGTAVVLYIGTVVSHGRRARAAGSVARPTSPFQMTAFLFGVATLEIAADWPMHDLSERSLYSIHMVQHLMFSMIAPPLLLLGVPAWMARSILRADRVRRLAYRATRPLLALIVFNAVVVITHWPALVDVTLRNEPAHFAAHFVLFTTAMLVWMPVVSPLPEFPRLPPLARCGFLFLQSIIPTVPASFLTFATHPIYKFYGHVPRLWGLGATEDQRIAGLIMKLGGGFFLWTVIAVVFFKWYADEERTDQRQRRWRRLEHELSRIEG
jgi:putative membrane protein